MSALQHQASERPVDPAAEHADDRTWFLLESKWEDDVWVLAPANALEERHPVRLRWDFELQDGQRFTDERYAVLRETSRQLIALIRAHSMFTGLPLRPSTVAQYFFTLRCLLQWMDGEGFSRFAQLDPPALLQFQQWLRTRPLAGHPSPRAPGTVLRHLYLFAYFHRFGGELDDSLSFDPFAGQDQRRAAGYHEGMRHPWPYTPDTVAVKLVQSAIDIVTRDAPVSAGGGRRSRCGPCAHRTRDTCASKCQCRLRRCAIPGAICPRTRSAHRLALRLVLCRHLLPGWPARQ
jgi:hypothetical protein